MGKQKPKGKPQTNAKVCQPDQPGPAVDAAPPEAKLVQPAPGARRPTISLCMMVKNEEKRLPTALKSAAPWVDEIIVVDTGSSDRTMQIARGFGAKIYEHPWEHSFSAHRNQSISYATGDWILILDADEEIDQSTAHWLHQLVHDPVVNTFFIELNNLLPKGCETFILHPRLFRNGLGFHYEGQVHNRPIFPEPAAKAPVRFIHYGYAEDEATMEVKHQRRQSMIQAWVDKEPDNFIARAYLSHTLLTKLETVDRAVEEGLTALRLAREQGAPSINLPRIYYPLLTALANQGNVDAVLSHGLDCLAAVPSYADAMFYVAWAHYVRQQWSAVCDDTRQFVRMQEHSRQHPEDYVYFENLTWERLAEAMMRWAVAAALVGRADESQEVIERMLPEAGAMEAAKQAVATILGQDLAAIARSLAERVMALRPEWEWPPAALGLAKQKLAQANLPALKAEGQAALEAGDASLAAQKLGQAAELDELNPEVRIGLGRALLQLGRRDQAEAQFMAGLDLNPGFAGAWEALARLRQEQDDWRGARTLWRRLLALRPGDAKVQAALAQCQAHLAGQPEPPSVVQAPPRLLVLLVAGLSPEMVRLPAPHFLMHRAWGEVSFGEAEAGRSGPAWATLYCGRGAGEHGLAAEPTRNRPLGLADLRLATIWDAIASRYRLGLAAIPLGHPAPALPGGGWAAAGWPGGAMRPALAQPPALAAQLLAAGYRSDMALNDLDDINLPGRLAQDVRQEGLLFQMERNRLKAVLALPAVDVLAVGLNLLEYSQMAHGLAHYHTFSAYQQLYGWIDILLATLRPAQFAILSQRSYEVQERKTKGVGFYCLSWLRGENGKAPAIEIAPQILKLLELDPAAWLGRPRG